MKTWGKNIPENGISKDKGPAAGPSWDVWRTTGRSAQLKTGGGQLGRECERNRLRSADPGAGKTNPGKKLAVTEAG